MRENINLGPYRHHPTHFLIFFLLQSTLGAFLLEGPNVCTFKEPYETSDGEVLLLWRNITTYEWCREVPFLCPGTKTVKEEKNKTQTKWRLVEECCEGYAKHETQNICIPICLQRCSRGKCVAPNVCECEFGFGGASCDINLSIFETDSDFRSQRLVEERSESNWFNEGEELLMVRILALLLAAIIATLLIYYCRKVSKLEAKLAAVQLAVDTQTTSGRRQFDNTAYIYGAESRADTDRYCLMTSSKNYHSKPKKMGRTASKIDAGGRTRTYLRIQDFREHQYAEIKDLVGQEERYDHLNFIPPDTTPRHGYQRLTSLSGVRQSNSFKTMEAFRNINTGPAQQRRLDIFIDLD